MGNRQVFRLKAPPGSGRLGGGSSLNRNLKDSAFCDFLGVIRPAFPVPHCARPVALGPNAAHYGGASAEALRPTCFPQTVL